MNKQLYEIIKDKNSNDVLLIGNKEVPLNKSNTSLEYQKQIYNCCQGDINYIAYEIKPSLYAVIEKKENEYSVKIINNQIINMIDVIKDYNYDFSMTYNSKYVVVYRKEHVCPIIDILAAYDIKMNKLIDCSNYKINNSLVDGVVKYRRCMYDVMSSIINNQILVKDQERLFSFMSFISNKKITENNFYDIAPIIKEYIYHNYPHLKNQTFYTDKKNILILNEQYGINNFVFRKMDYDIGGLTYIKEKTLIKK